MTRLTSISLAGTIGKNYYGIGRDPGVVTKTIGTASRDYSTIAAWEADLDNTGVYMTNDEAVGECYNDSSFTFSSAIAIDTNATLSSIKLTAPRSERHDGTAGTGARLTNTGTSFGSYFINVADPNVSIEFLEFEFDDYFGYDGFGIRLQYGNNVSNCDINGCLFHSLENGSVYPSLGVYINANKPNVRVHNNFFITMGYCIRSSYGGNAYVYNNTGYGSSTTNRSYVGIDYINFSTNVDIRSNIMANFQTVDIDTGWTIPPTTNATSDSSGQITGITPSDHFVSIVSGSEDLHLVKSSSLRGAGQDLGSSYGPDINDSNRHALSATVWDIGAHQYASTASIGTSSRDYSTIAAWEAGLDDTSIYGTGANAVGECYNDSAFVERINISGGTSLNSTILTVAQGQRHDGTADTGARLESPSNWGRLAYIGNGNVPTMLEYLEMKNQHATANALIEIGAYCYGKRISKILLYSAGNSRPPGYIGGGFWGMTLDNSILYGDVNSSGNGVVANVQFTGADIVNNSFYLRNIALQIQNQPNAISKANIKNNVAASILSEAYQLVNTPGTASFPHWNSNITNGSVLYGDNAYTGISAADLFVSVVAGSEDLHLSKSSYAIGRGLDMSSEVPEGGRTNVLRGAGYATTDAVGVDRTSLWAMGAIQLDPAGHIRSTLLRVG